MMIPEARVRRLESFDDPTMDGIPAFDRGQSYEESIELPYLNHALGFSLAFLELNAAELQKNNLLRGDLVFDIIDDPTVNAFAWTKEGNDAIVISAGLCLCLRIFFHHVVRCTDVFPWLEEENLGRKPPFELTRIPVTLADFLEDSARADFEHLELLKHGPAEVRPFPRMSKDRLALSNWLWMNSLQFIICHELGHILCGHTDYLAANALGVPLAELARSSVSPDLDHITITSSEVQSQEREADDIATAISFLSLFLREAEMLPTCLRSRPDVDANINIAYYAWGFSVAAVFLVVAMAEKGFASLNMRNPSDKEGMSREYGRAGITHPHPFGRLGTAAASCVLLAGQHYDDPPPTYPSIIRGWMDLDKALVAVFGNQYQGYFNVPDTQLVTDFRIVLPLKDTPWRKRIDKTVYTWLLPLDFGI